MQGLPKNENLPISKLISCFNNTSATYKFYWLLSILEQVENGKLFIPKIDLFAGMVSQAWYTVHYFHISFGKSDILGDHIQKLKEIENLEIDTPRNLIYEKLIQSENKHTQRLLKHFDRNVPHWFLSPWFPNCNQNEIYRRSNDISQLALYSLSNDFVTINQSWVRYLQENAGIIRSFCLWNLSLFLQARNPNIPDIPNKLIKPAYRNSLTKQRGFWNIIFNELNTIKCIYTDDLLMMNDYALEHFIPYNFISHDLIWNLIPSNSCFNIKKSDKLPRLDIHFQPFYDIQKKGVEIMTEKHPRHPLLEDYLTIFPNLHDSFTPERYYKHLQPLISIASNNGFELLNV